MERGRLHTWFVPGGNRVTSEPVQTSRGAMYIPAGARFESIDERPEL